MTSWHLLARCGVDWWGARARSVVLGFKVPLPQEGCMGKNHSTDHMSTTRSTESAPRKIPWNWVCIGIYRKCFWKRNARKRSGVSFVELIL